MPFLSADTFLAATRFFDGLSRYFFNSPKGKVLIANAHGPPGEKDSAGADGDVWAFCRSEQLINES